MVTDGHLRGIAHRLHRAGRRTPLACRLSHDRGRTPPGSIAPSGARQRAKETVAEAHGCLDDRPHFVVTASYGTGREEMTVAMLSAWLSPSAHVEHCDPNRLLRPILCKN
jgi:hypothetical protein